MEGPAYLLLDSEGSPIEIAPTLPEAMSMAESMASDDEIWIDAPSQEDVIGIEAGEAQEDALEELPLAANPKRRLRVMTGGEEKIRSAPEDALMALLAAAKRVGEPFVDFDEAMRMDPEEAYSRIVDFFPRYKYTKSTGQKVRVKSYDKAIGTSANKGMAFNILGQNYKTAKGTPPHIIAQLFEQTGFRKANVLGLSILPTTQSYTEPMVRDIMASASRFYSVKSIMPTRLNSCVRATPECSSSCLVFSGRNLSDDYNTVKKYALLQSLVHEPEAFMRMLIEAIRIHRDSSFRANTMPLVRLNVFSDLPWELMTPELFELFEDVQFYDYTKVPNRQTPSNYDLTFSFAGTPQNVDAMDFEIRERNRRVAVVFAAVGMRTIPGTGRVEIPRTPTFYRRKPGAERKTGMYARLPKTFLGLPVIDGDESDMRPYDPSPSIVGLRWKNPANQNVTLEQAKVFIVLVDLVKGPGGYVDAVVSKTARFDDVDYSKYAASNTDT